MAKYSFSRQITNNRGEAEVFTANEFASFDEAIRAVEKGVSDRKLELQKENKPKNDPHVVAGFGKDKVQGPVDEIPSTERSGTHQPEEPLAAGAAPGLNNNVGNNQH